MTYLSFFFCDGKRLNPRTSMSTFTCRFLHVHCTDAAIYFSLVFILFDDDSGLDGRSGELPFFDGYYVG